MSIKIVNEIWNMTDVLNTEKKKKKKKKKKKRNTVQLYKNLEWKKKVSMIILTNHWLAKHQSINQSMIY
jgi:hypothetical protein